MLATVPNELTSGPASGLEIATSAARLIGGLILVTTLPRLARTFPTPTRVESAEREEKSSAPVSRQ